MNPHINSYKLFFSLFYFLFVLSSAHSNIVILNGLSHSHDVKIGAKQRGHIELQNTKSSKQAVKVYQRDYFFQHNGETHYDPIGSHDRSNGHWIDINPTYIVLEAEEKSIISYNISTPKNDSLFGTYWSVIMIEGIEPEQGGNIKSGLNVKTVVRYAIQIATNIKENSESSLEFIDIKLPENIRTLEIDIKNNGDLLLKPLVSIELFDTNGSSAGKVIADRKKIYPDTSVRFLLDIKEFEQGKYKALVIADCNDEEVFGINLTLELKNDQ